MISLSCFYNFFINAILKSIFCICIFVCARSNQQSSKFYSCENDADVDVGEPLYLTTLLKTGKIDEARDASNVRPMLAGVVGNSGFFTVNETYNSNLFFWFIRKESDDWDKAPLILWLTGGPGYGSVKSLFLESGPYVVKGSNLKRRKFSWTRDYNMLYIDNPVGAGFSFTNDAAGYVFTEMEVAVYIYEALTQFFLLYAELKDNDFYITGDSYGGKFAVAAGYNILEENSNRKTQINLKGLLISGTNPCDHESTFIKGELGYKLGLLDAIQSNYIKSLESDGRYYIRSRLWKNATKAFWEVHEQLLKFLSMDELHDYTHERPKQDKRSFNLFLQRPSTRKNLHVGTVPYFYVNVTVQRNFDVSAQQNQLTLVEKLLKYYRIMFYSGQLDLLYPYESVSMALRKLRWSEAKNFNGARRNRWYVGRTLGGYYKVAGNLVEVMVRNAGHLIALHRPKFCLELVKKFIKNELIDTAHFPNEE